MPQHVNSHTREEGEIFVRDYLRRGDPAAPQFHRTRQRAVPHWEQRFNERTGEFDHYRGTFKGVRLYVGRAVNETWYWSATKGGKGGFFKDSVDFIQEGGPESTSPGEAARRAELAAGYEYAAEILNYKNLKQVD